MVKNGAKKVFGPVPDPGIPGDKRDKSRWIEPYMEIYCFVPFAMAASAAYHQLLVISKHTSLEWWCFGGYFTDHLLGHICMARTAGQWSPCRRSRWQRRMLHVGNIGLGLINDIHIAGSLNNSQNGTFEFSYFFPIIQKLPTIPAG